MHTLPNPVFLSLLLTEVALLCAVYGFRKGREAFVELWRFAGRILHGLGLAFLVLGGVAIAVAGLTHARGAPVGVAEVAAALAGPWGTFPFRIAATVVTMAVPALAGASLGWSLRAATRQRD